MSINNKKDRFEFDYLTSKSREKRIKSNTFCIHESITGISPKYNPHHYWYRTENRCQVSIIEKQKWVLKIKKID